MLVSFDAITTQNLTLFPSSNKDHQNTDCYNLLCLLTVAETYMENTVLLSVGPPSPPVSSCCSDLDHQEAVLRSWTISASLPDTPSSPITPPPLERDSDDDEAWTNQTRPKAYNDHGHQPLPSRRSPRSQVDREGEGKKTSDLYKTEMCRSVAAGTTCRYADQCQFAHSEDELNQVARHPRYKTQFCTSFQTYGQCKYNDRCTFIHHPSEARTPSMNRRANAQIRAKAVVKTASIAGTADKDRRRKDRSDPDSMTYATIITKTTATATATATCGSVCVPLTPDAEPNPPKCLAPSVHMSHHGAIQNYTVKIEEMSALESFAAQAALYQTPYAAKGTTVVLSAKERPSLLSSSPSSQISCTALPLVNTTLWRAAARHQNGMHDAQNPSQMDSESIHLAEDEPPTWLASLGRYIGTPQNEFEL
ncbi:hypothetical protein BGZ73_005406 [Actinomortierella ambigua]|nr:hypothetical protein BGZ73_005406 [Actinomortierella ambigua]